MTPYEETGESQQEGTRGEGHPLSDSEKLNHDFRRLARKCRFVAASHQNAA
jgi:hypothetical protein